MTLQTDSRNSERVSSNASSINRLIFPGIRRSVLEPGSRVGGVAAPVVSRSFCKSFQRVGQRTLQQRRRGEVLAETVVQPFPQPASGHGERRRLGGRLLADRVGCRPAQGLFQFGRTEGLDQVQLEASVVAAGAVGGVAQSAHRNGVRGPAALGIQSLQQLPTVAVGQGNVAQQQIKSVLLGEGKSPRLVLGKRGTVTQRLEKRLDPLARVGMVFNHEDVQRTGPGRAGLDTPLAALGALRRHQDNSPQTRRPDGSFANFLRHQCSPGLSDSKYSFGKAMRRKHGR